MWIALVVVVAVLVWRGLRMGELFFVSVRDGRVLVVRGRVPTSLLQAFAEAVAEPPVRRGSIRAWPGEAGAELTCRGIGEGRAQRMRNAFMLYPVSKLRAAPSTSERSAGQILGIAWLAWLLARR